jgi:DNA-binding MarR family transcriptional regulator
VNVRPNKSVEEYAAEALEVLPELPRSTPGSAGAHLPDGLLDGLDKAFRRLRRTMVRPPAGLVPVPALGRQLDLAKIFACEAVAELSATMATVSVKDVAASLELEHSTVSRLLGEIEDDGLVTRGVDAADRRRTTLELTELGRAVVADATSVSRFFTRIMLAEWPREDVEQLVTLLGRLHETAQERLSSLPELAIAEFRRAQSSSQPGVHSGPTPSTSPPSTR